MKVLVLLFSLILTLNLASAQQTKAANESSIRTAITNYIEGYYTGDAGRMESSLHPHYLKHTISRSGEQARMKERTGLEMV